MVRPTIEVAMRTLYGDKVPVRRHHWDSGLQVVLPEFEDDVPELLLPEDARVIFAPTRDDILMEDWERVDGKPFTRDNSPGGLYRAMLYLHATGNPVRALDWAPASYVRLTSSFDGSMIIHFEEEGAESETQYIPTRWDYLTELWTVYRKGGRDVGTGKNHG